MLRKTIFSLIFLLIASTASAYNATPGEGTVIKPARATWLTGFFHETIIRMGLEELGYTVKKPKTLNVPLFFKSVAFGDVDYWPNAWFTAHAKYLEAEKEKISVVGYVSKENILQGYMIDKKTAEELKITSLEDFKRPEVVKAFDKNDDGLADLTGAPHGWKNVAIINDQIKQYGLTEYIKQNNAAYEPAMAANIGAQKSGEPIFYYSWSPSWMDFKIRPGVESVWINVPFDIPVTDDPSELTLMTQKDLAGAVTNPLKMGFAAASLRIVANNEFLKKNPAAKQFFELFTISTQDLSAQYLKIFEGESSEQDIERHAREWIAANKVQWNAWLEQVRTNAK